MKRSTLHRAVSLAKVAARHQSLLAVVFWSPPDPPDRNHFWQARYSDFNVWSKGKMIEKLRYLHRNPSGVQSALATSRKSPTRANDARMGHPGLGGWATRRGI